MTTETTATTETQLFFQVNYTDRFRNRQYKVVAAKNDIEAIDVLMRNEPTAKNAYAQQITEKEYQKVVNKQENSLCMESYWENHNQGGLRAN